MKAVLVKIWAVAMAILAVPLILSVLNFGIGTVTNPRDTEANAERAADVIGKAIEHERPAWLDPTSLFLALLAAAFLVLVVSPYLGIR
ncbi:MAG TPA: hypothetical protein VM681_11215 [Candidatus Thermoplasmatota archaeon]|nr:hypothetical protein [Candidatus Thermoplasmatota archaeon]